MSSLADVREQLAEQRARVSRVVVSEDELRLAPSGRLRGGGRTFELSDGARGELAREAGIPAGFFGKLPPDLQDTLFNRLYPERLDARGGAGSVALVLREDEQVVGLDDPALAVIPNDEVLALSLAARQESVDEDEVDVAKFHLDGELRLSLLSRQYQAEPRPGDIVRAGLDIRHSETGKFGTRIESYLHRLVCRNGMVAKVCGHTAGVPSRIRRAASGNAELTRQRITQAAGAAWNELAAKMAAAEVLAGENVSNAAALIRSIGQQLRFPKKLVERVVEALTADELEPSGSLWDIIAAFSRVGTHDHELSTATQYYLQELSGDLVRERVDRCPTCGAIRRGGLRHLPRR